MSRLPSDLAAAVRILEQLPDGEQLAEDRWNDGTATLEDVPIFADECVRDEVARQIVDLAMPFKRLMAAGRNIPIGSGLASIVGHLAAYRPEESPDRKLIQRFHALLQGYPTESEEAVQRHRVALLCRWALGSPDGIPLRQAIARGDFGDEAAADTPPPGYGSTSCPIGCGFRAEPASCLCTGTADEISVDIMRRGHQSRTDATSAPATAENVQIAAIGGQPRPPKSTQAPPQLDEIQTPSAAPEPYRESGPPPEPPTPSQRNRSQVFNAAHRRLR